MGKKRAKWSAINGQNLKKGAIDKFLTYVSLIILKNNFHVHYENDDCLLVQLF